MELCCKKNATTYITILPIKINSKIFQFQYNSSK